MAVEPGPDGRFTLSGVQLPASLRNTFDDLGAWGLLDLAPVAMALVDGDGSILFANQALLELFGYDASELVGEPIERLLPPEVRAVHHTHRARYASEPRVRPMGVGLELRAVRADGSSFPVEVSLAPVSSADGELVVLAGVTDITPRQEAARETTRVRRLLDAASEGIVVFDVDTMRATYVNAGSAAIAGRSREELLAIGPDELDARLEPERIRRFVHQLGGQHLVSTTFDRADGDSVEIDLLVSRPSIDEGQGHLLVVLVRDVTDQRRAGNDLALVREQLAVAEDRDRIARDLHDTVIQQLFGIGLKLQGAAQRVGGPSAAQVEDAVDAIDEAIRELRTAVFGLGHRTRVEAAQRDLTSEIEQVLDESSRVLGFRPSLVASGVSIDRIPPAVASELIPTLREALANVARHADASMVHVALVGDGTHLVLEVVDDGVGVQLPLVRPGNGIANLRARAARLGGSLDLRAGGDGGTIVRWSVPLVATR
jgi:PAS domain S-box-containing protein